MENYNMLKADRYVAIDGHQNISFSLSDTQALRQRIDRFYDVSGL
jgi:hypothetical protein